MRVFWFRSRGSLVFLYNSFHNIVHFFRWQTVFPILIKIESSWTYAVGSRLGIFFEARYRKSKSEKA